MRVCCYLINFFKTNRMAFCCIRITSHLIWSHAHCHTSSLLSVCCVHILSHQFDKTANWHWHCFTSHHITADTHVLVWLKDFRCAFKKGTTNKTHSLIKLHSYRFVPFLSLLFFLLFARYRIRALGVVQVQSIMSHFYIACKLSFFRSFPFRNKNKEKMKHKLRKKPRAMRNALT